MLLQPGRCVHDVVGDLKQLLNSRSQTSVHLGQLASGRFAPIGDMNCFEVGGWNGADSGLSGFEQRIAGADIQSAHNEGQTAMRSPKPSLPLLRPVQGGEDEITIGIFAVQRRRVTTWVPWLQEKDREITLFLQIMACPVALRFYLSIAHALEYRGKRRSPV